MPAVCVFCGSSSGRQPVYAEVARALGAALAGAGWTLVYGGGRVGLMGAVADAALAAGGDVIGVIPETLARREVAHTGLTQLHRVDGMHARKALMAQISDAFIALPGGFGTLDELCEILTWAQLGLHAKPTLLLDVQDYFAPLMQFFERAVDEGFIRPDRRDLLRQVNTVPAALALLQSSAAAASGSP